MAAVERPDDGSATGIDMNVGQVATSDGEIISGPDTSLLEARCKRLQRRMSRQKKGSRRRERTRRRHARTLRRIAMKRCNWQHHVSRKLAGGTVVVEDLNTRGMTRSAKGTIEDPGTGVRQKAGLNRAILATCGRCSATRLRASSR